jgi:hypothetical protein
MCDKGYTMDSDVVNKLREFTGYEKSNTFVNGYYNNSDNYAVDGSKQNDINDYISNISENLRVKGSVDTHSLILKDSLRSESNTLFQTISNLNEGIGIVSIMDNAINEQLSYLNELKSATTTWQSAETTSQKSSARLAINDILDSFDDTSKNTTYKGISLLSKDDIFDFINNNSLHSNATTSNHTGYISIFRSDNIESSGTSSLAFNINGQEIELETQDFSSSEYGVKDLAELINNNSDRLDGMEARWSVKSEGSESVDGGLLKSLNINGIDMGDVSIMSGDLDENLINTINKYTNQTGVSASIKEIEGVRSGILSLESDGRGIEIDADNIELLNLEDTNNYGRLTLIQDGTTTINFSDKDSLIDSGDYFKFNLANVFDGITFEDTVLVGDGSTTTGLDYYDEIQYMSSEVLPHKAMDIAISEDEQTAVIAGYNKGLYVIDMNTKNVEAVIDTAGKALETSDMYFDGDKVFFADDNGGLAILDLATYSISDTINTPSKAKSVEVSEDGNTAYVADFNSGVQVIDLTSNTIVDSISTFGKANDVELSKDGNKLYVADGNKGLTTIDLNSMSVTNNMSLPGQATSMQLSNDGNTMYVASSTGGINVVDLTTNTLQANIATSGKATDLRISDDETRMYVAASSGGLNMIDLTTNTLIDTYSTGGKAQGVELSQDGTTVYVADFNNGLSIFKVADEVTTVNTPTSQSEKSFLDDDELVEFALDSIESSINHLSKYSDIINNDKSVFERDINALTNRFLQTKMREANIEDEMEATTFDKNKLFSDVSSFAFSKDVNELKNISIKLLLEIDSSMLPENSNENEDSLFGENKTTVEYTIDDYFDSLNDKDSDLNSYIDSANILNSK